MIGFIELAVQGIALKASKQVSSIQTPSCLVYKGDCTTQLCRDYTKPFSRSLIKPNQDFMECHKAAPWGADGPELQRRMQEHFDSTKGGGGRVIHG